MVMQTNFACIFSTFKPESESKLTFSETHIWADLSPDIGRWLLRRAKIVRDLGPVNPFWIGSGPPKVGGWGPPVLQIKASFRYRPAAVGAQPLKLYRKHRKYPFIPKMPGGIYDVKEKFVSILVNK